MPKEVHIGQVTNNTIGPDGLPFTKGELMFKADTLLADAEYPIPAVPSFPLADPLGFGIFWVPAVGSTVELEIAAGMEYLLEEQVRYRCALYSNINDIPLEFKINYPNRRGFKFKSGIFMFDDTEGAFLVQLFHFLGHGFELTLDGDVNWVAVRDFTIQVVRNLIMEAVSKVVIEGPRIELTQGATEAMVLGTQLLNHLAAIKASYDSHGHTGVTTGPGITGAPVAPLPDAPPTLVSTKIYGS